MTGRTPWETRNALDDEEPMGVGDVCRLFKVHPKTVARWADTNKLASFRTPGGHRRFRHADVMEWFQKWSRWEEKR